MNEIEDLPAIEKLSLNFHKSANETEAKSQFSYQNSQACSSSADDSSHNEMDVVNQTEDLRGRKRKHMESLEDQAQRLTRIVIEECMSRAVIRKCWLCRRRYVKEGGCNAVRCVCGATSCFHCGRRVAHRIHLGCPAVTSADDLRLAVSTAARRARASKRPRLAARLLWQESSDDDDDDD